MKRGFSLIELLVALAVLLLLAALGVPPVLTALERARVARVVSDLRTAEVALEAYRTDHGGYPPVTASCAAGSQGEALQLPPDLSAGGYLPQNGRSATSTALEDPFHPGHTYKYVAPENYWLNGSKQSDRYPVWVPSDFPACLAASGKLDDAPNSPLAWAVWSEGPRPDPAQALDYKRPLDSSGWYRRTGAAGVIARYKERNGATWTTPR
ncbi:MAG TPA: prepilin-type N-terminal cleavage/methylation domain-containing protein [Kiritimatiellia bacterium]|nr:prepilin-type N-terminal cleavage/methylation domain-containing protein [Kiritimatiellia bacterium]